MHHTIDRKREDDDVSVAVETVRPHARATPSLDPATRSRGSRIAAVAAACSGNMVEWFDLHICGLLAAYLSVAFFAPAGSTDRLIDIAGVFALGLLARPLGGWIFGAVADRSGRRRSLVLSALAMCVASLVIAFAPTYQAIGGWAPVLLLVARLMQGIAVGGEYGTVAAYLSEVAPAGRRGFYGSFQYGALIGGQLAAMLALMLLRLVLGEPALADWGWRIPFVVGALAALVALVLRLRLQEPVDAERSHRRGAGTMALLWREHRSALVTILLLTAGGVLSVFTFAVYARQTLITSGSMPAALADQVTTAGLVVFLCMQPVCGALADRVGRRSNMLAFAASGVICTIPILSELEKVRSPVAAFALVVLGFAITSLYTSVSGVVKADLFPPEVRALAVGFASSLASVGFAGSAALVSASLASIGQAGLFHAYVTAMIALVGLLSVNRGRMRYLSEAG